MAETTERLNTALAGRYRIQRQLGQGGMATVYLAEDLRHKRQVAVKVLKPDLAAVLGAERFVQEITTTASLQHPHILPLFDSGEADGFLYYVMPYVEGETLRDKLNRETQLAIEEALKITSEIADALDYAHRHGVIHRDIKPENILLHDGRPMVADFGIALAVSAAAGGRMTETGLSLGTPHYMSPEQATAEKDLTARSDVYSLASMLYEMLTGDPPHTGSSAQQIIMKIVTDVARPVTELRKSVPRNVAAAVAKALEKLPADRFNSAAEFAAALSEPGYSGTSATESTITAPARTDWRAKAAVPLAVTTLILMLVVGYLSSSEAPDPVTTHLAIKLDSDQGLMYSGIGNRGRLSLMPDGSGVIYVGLDSVVMAGLSEVASAAGSAGWKLWHRSFNQLRAEPLFGTEGAWNPAISPDGKRLAFMTYRNGTAIHVMELDGSPAIEVYQGPIAGPVSWGADQNIYFFEEGSPVVKRISAQGGLPETVVTLNPTTPGSEFWAVRPLPTGKGALVMEQLPASDLGRPPRFFVGRQNVTVPELNSAIHIVDLATGETRDTLAGVDARYVPAGYLLALTWDGTVKAAEFSANKLSVDSRWSAILQDVEIRRAGHNDLSVAGRGELIAYTNWGYNVPERVVWIMPDGTSRPVDPAWTREVEFEALALSPDGGRLAVQIFNTEREDIWVKVLENGPLSRLTFEGQDNIFPAWTPDGRYISYTSRRTEPDGTASWGVWRKRADGSGSEELVISLDQEIMQANWSHSGDWLLLSVGGTGSADKILGYRPGVDSAPRDLVASAADEFEPSLSPDDRWLAYVSNETGRRELYARPFPETHSARWQLTTDGAMEPVWSKDGRTIYYRSLDGQKIRSVSISGGPSQAVPGREVVLHGERDYEVNPRNWLFDRAADGRFIMVERPSGGDISGDMILLQGALAQLRAKVGN